MNSHDKSYASTAADADRKRALAKKLICQYYQQLTQGCGNSECNNEHCASNPYIQKFEPNEAAALSLRLWKSKARFCLKPQNSNQDSSTNHLSGVPSGMQDSRKGFENSTSPDESCMDVSVPCSFTVTLPDGLNGSTTNEQMHINSDIPGTKGDIASSIQNSVRNGSSVEMSEVTNMDTSYWEPCVGNSSNNMNLGNVHHESPNSTTKTQPSVISDNASMSGSSVMEVDVTANLIPEAVFVENSNGICSTSVGSHTNNVSSPAKTIDFSESAQLAITPINEENLVMDTSDAAEPSASATNSSVPFNKTMNVETAGPSNLQRDSSSSDLQSKDLPKGTMSLNEESLMQIIEDCRNEEKYSLLIRTLGQVFSSEEALQASFVKPPKPPVSDMSKEEIRAMELDEDKDRDSKEIGESSCAENAISRNCEVTVDIPSLRRSFKALFSIPDYPFQCALINALIILSENLEFDLKYGSRSLSKGNVLNIFVIVMEMPMLECPEYMEAAFPAFCKAAALLPVSAQATLAKVWSTFEAVRLKEMVDTLHQFITLKVITGHFTRDYCMNDDETIVSATKLMKILYYANILGGKIEPESQCHEEEPVEEHDSFHDFAESKEPREMREDVLAQELLLKPIDCRSPIINFDEFYNEPLSDQIEMDRDFACYKTEGGKFSFMNYSFILTPAVKALGLYYDNRIRMYSERRISVLHSLVHGAPPNPYLKLKVKRDHLIDDALVGLEMVAMENPNNLKKQLVVEFENEQGIDEGGVSKEFFQLVVEEVFNPDFAMFTLNPETQTYWFNPTSFESDAQFTLIGIILGLAIYNNIILDVHFPMVLYRKLMGKKGTYYDLQDWNPVLSKGLKDLLEYEGDDIENAFMQSFRITYQDVFGTVLLHDLKENGDNILVNQSNKKEFVELYASFLLNKSVAKQFRAFQNKTKP